MADDHAWAVVEKAFTEGRYSFSVDLLRDCFKVAEEHQFDEERELALRKLSEVVESYVADHLQTEGDDNAD